MLGSLILYIKGMRRLMFQLSGFYFIGTPLKGSTFRILPVVWEVNRGSGAPNTPESGREHKP